MRHTACENGEAAARLDPAMVQTAVNAIRTHLAEQGDLRTQAIEETLITLSADSITRLSDDYDAPVCGRGGHFL